MFKISDSERTVPIEFHDQVYHLRYPDGCPFKVSILATELVGLAGGPSDVVHLSGVIQQMLEHMFVGEVPSAAEMSGQQVMALMEYFQSLSNESSEVEPHSDDDAGLA